MKPSSLFASTALVLSLAACALIPPIAIGPDALGFTEQEFTIPLDSTASGASGTVTSPQPIVFSDIEPPSFPIAPRSLRSVQGFTRQVQVSGSPGGFPESLTLAGGSLSFAVGDQRGTPEAVTAGTDFGPLELRRTETCSLATTCGYEFVEPEAAARATTVSVGGTSFRRLLTIITEGEDNELEPTISASIDADLDSITLTLKVQQNYIRF